MLELPPAGAPDPDVAGNGPVVRALAILFAATSRRKLAAESPDVAIESVLMDTGLHDKYHPFLHLVREMCRRVFPL